MEKKLNLKKFSKLQNFQRNKKIKNIIKMKDFLKFDKLQNFHVV